MYLRLKSADQLGGHHFKSMFALYINRDGFWWFFVISDSDILFILFKGSMLGAAMKYLIVSMLLCSSCSPDLFFLNKNLSKLLYLPSGSSKQHSDVALCIDLFVLICICASFISAPSRPLVPWLERAMSGLPLPPEDLVYWKLKSLFSDNLLEVCAETSGFSLLKLKNIYNRCRTVQKSPFLCILHKQVHQILVCGLIYH